MEVIKVCLKYSTGFINIVSIILSVLLVIILSFGIEKLQANAFQKNEKQEIISKEKTIDIKNTIKEESIENNIKEKNEIAKDEIQNEEYEFDWYLEIPKIKLYAPIEEGTEVETLDRSVGHFENTSRKNGNCGLAAHNRGYRVNYFANVKELEIGDAIFYFVDGKKYEYEVTKKDIIYETDWSYLEETEDCRLTLITCVENREEYRLCVQATQNKKEE